MILKKNSVEYTFLSESLKRAKEDIAILTENAYDISPEDCYELMCYMEAIKENIEKFEVSAKNIIRNI